MTSKRAKSVYHTSLWRAGTLESSRSTPIASPQTGPVLDFSPCRGSSGECSFNGGQSVAVLLRQKLIGIKDFGKK
jgi:hypothetical protein